MSLPSVRPRSSISRGSCVDAFCTLTQAVRPSSVEALLPPSLPAVSLPRRTPNERPTSQADSLTISGIKKEERVVEMARDEGRKLVRPASLSQCLAVDGGGCVGSASSVRGPPVERVKERRSTMSNIDLSALRSTHQENTAFSFFSNFVLFNRKKSRKRREKLSPMLARLLGQPTTIGRRRRVEDRRDLPRDYPLGKLLLLARLGADAHTSLAKGQLLQKMRGFHVIGPSPSSKLRISRPPLIHVLRNRVRARSAPTHVIHFLVHIYSARTLAHLRAFDS